MRTSEFRSSRAGGNVLAVGVLPVTWGPGSPVGPVGERAPHKLEEP